MKMHYKDGVLTGVQAEQPGAHFPEFHHYEQRLAALEDKIEAKQTAFVPVNELGKRIADLEAACAKQRAVYEALDAVMEALSRDAVSRGWSYIERSVYDRIAKFQAVLHETLKL